MLIKNTLTFDAYIFPTEKWITTVSLDNFRASRAISIASSVAPALCRIFARLSSGMCCKQPGIHELIKIQNRTWNLSLFRFRVNKLGVMNDTEIIVRTLLSDGTNFKARRRQSIALVPFPNALQYKEPRHARTQDWGLCTIAIPILAPTTDKDSGLAPRPDMTYKQHHFYYIQRLPLWKRTNSILRIEGWDNVLYQTTSMN